MGALLKNGVHAAYHIARMDKQAFVRKFGEEIGGAQDAARVYDKAVQVHHAVLNVAVSYITARSGLRLGANPLPDGQPNAASQPSAGGQPSTALAMASRNGNNGQVLQPAPAGPTPENADDIIAYPTLESLFGSMDFCTCADCRSVLSPAAYLVDLLEFIDHEPAPAEKAAGQLNPQSILLDRRPDLQHLPLTCENTNTALPYIDVVNETLEYFIADKDLANKNKDKLSLKNYTGHDTDGMASADLLATPQFVMDLPTPFCAANAFLRSFLSISSWRICGATLPSSKCLWLWPWNTCAGMMIWSAERIRTAGETSWLKK